MSTDAPAPSRRRLRWVLAAVAVALVAALGAVGAAVAASSQPGHFGKYPGLKRRATAVAASAHRELTCVQCHVDARGPVVAGAALVADFYRGLSGNPKLPAYVRLTAPTNDACLACHRHDWSDDASRTLKVPHPAHLRVAAETRSCVGCHKWVAHEEEYQAKHKTMPFSGVCASYGCHVGTKTPKDCVDCHHVLQEGRAVWRTEHPKAVRRQGPGTCTDSCHRSSECRQCHTTGVRPVMRSGIATAGVSTVERLHVKKDWLSRHGGIALSDPKKCRICHISEGECEDCHAIRPAFHGPKSTWLARHKDLSKDERRCLACHEKPWCEKCHTQFKEMR